MKCEFVNRKEVPAEIAAYLINCKETLMEEFQMACPKLSLTGYANHNYDRIVESEQKNAKLSEQVILL